MMHLTRERILAIAGDLSDGAVAEIERLGASEADLLAAVGSLGDGPPPHRESGRPLAGPAAALQAILAAEDASREGDEDRRT
jgi:hypothetical protein